MLRLGSIIERRRRYNGWPAAMSLLRLPINEDEDFSERIFALPKMMGWHLDGFGLSLNQQCIYLDRLQQLAPAQEEV